MTDIDFYFDFISPYSYLAATRIPAFEQQHHASFKWLPVNLPRLINNSGNTPPTQIYNKARYSLRDLKRWARFLNVPFTMIKPGSFDSRPAMRIAGALSGNDRADFCQAVFDSIWSGDINPLQQDWLAQVMREKNLPDAWLSLDSEEFELNTQQALKAGAFGAPTFFLHGQGRPEMFFGLDHMDFLARACAIHTTTGKAET